MPAARRLLVLVLVLAALCAAAGCQSIVGIEDRTYNAASSECRSYCTRVMQKCTAENAVYASMEACLGVCADLPAGDAAKPGSDNTVACRDNQLNLGTELSVVCPRAGPGGDGACGTNCDGYCALFAKACPDDAKLVTDCAAKCQGLRVDSGFDVAANASGDSVQCRLVHASAATLDSSECNTARIPSSAPCADPAGSKPSCDDYCKLVMAECQSDLAVYDSVAQCKAVCAKLPPGTVDDTNQDTVGCRKYHSYNAVLDPGTHCAHAGPSGDGHCGTDNCESYCILAEQACPTEFAATFSGGKAACQAACANTDGSQKNTGYSVATADAHTVQCRIHHAVLAFSDPTECAAAFGQGACN